MFFVNFLLMPHIWNNLVYTFRRKEFEIDHIGFYRTCIKYVEAATALYLRTRFHWIQCIVGHALSLITKIPWIRPIDMKCFELEHRNSCWNRKSEISGRTRERWNYLINSTGEWRQSTEIDYLPIKNTN